ncbi:MAG: 5-formyltetrahydrofolate cyclo-ligase [Proteobacteria bacterium]|nr:5-formyltetrahydrofolate cyclo-ligase [Pseudomonadota bacterium]MCH8177145.1 5-formyltetrahydrofolate cyclo-ligase [Pseudomonadota bacterium]
MDNSIDQLRKRHRDLRAGLSSSAQEQAGKSLCERLTSLPEYQQSERIAAYFAVNGEISLEPLIDHAWCQGKSIFLPNLDRQSLRFSPYFLQQKMRINRYRLPEPDVSDDEMLAPEALDLVLAPLVVFDAGRNRIGMGGGFYDRSFAFRKDLNQPRPALIGVAHELQKVVRLEPQDWDIQLDMVVTDQAIYR